jgi:hypothetical protein
MQIITICVTIENGVVSKKIMHLYTKLEHDQEFNNNAKEVTLNQSHTHLTYANLQTVFAHRQRNFV